MSLKVALKVITGFFVAAPVLVPLVAVIIQTMPEIQEFKEFQKKFELVQIGNSEAEVLSILGLPDAKEKEFRLGQREGFEEAYSRAEASDSTYYLLWFRAIDFVFTVGINNKGQVSAKESGGT